MSSNVVWELVKRNTAFTLKRGNHTFTTEPQNLTNRNTFQYSGFAAPKTVDVSASDDGIVLTTKSAKSDRTSRPSKALTRTTLRKDFRRVARAVKNTTDNYRPDLTKAALARASALNHAKYLSKSGATLRTKTRGKLSN